MSLLTYAIAEASKGTKAELFPVSFSPLANGAWQRLADNVASLNNLTPFPARVLFSRWRQGYATIAVVRGEIVAYISCQPILFQATRQKLSEKLGIDSERLPDVNVYEFLTGWTHPAWRRKNISLQLRRQLMARLCNTDHFCISVTVGLGASPVSAKLGWQVVPWSEIPYVSSIIGSPSASGTGGEPNGWQVSGHKPYEGKQSPPFQDAGPEWEGYCYFWVSNPRLAVELNRKLAALVNGDLPRWQNVWQTEIRGMLINAGWLPVIFEE